MFWKSGKKEPNNSKESSTALVRQDPRTKVRTATAESETTNTTEKNATIYDNLRNKITQQTVRQTVTHQQTAKVTEISIRRTPTKEELNELLNVTGRNETFFKSSTPWTKQETTVTQTNGCMQTSYVQQQRMKMSQTGNTTTTTTKCSTATGTPTTTESKMSSAHPKNKQAKALPDYTDSFGKISPLRMLSAPTITTSPPLVSNAPLSISTSNTTTSSYGSGYISPLSKVTKGSQNTSKIAVNAVWSKNEKSAAANSYSTNCITLPNIKTTTISSTPPQTITHRALQCKDNNDLITKNNNKNEKTTTISSLSSPAPPTTSTKTTTTGYISPYAAYRARGPLTSSYSYAYGKPSTTVSSGTTYNFRALADANPTARATKIITTKKPIETVTTAVAWPKFNYNTPASELPTKTQTTAAVLSSKSKLKPGYAVIFNSVDFADKERFEKRDGSDYDAKIIRETLEQYKLKVETIKNPTVKKIKDFVKNLAKKDYTQYSCLLIAILSHGSLHDSIAASDGEYNVDETMLYPLLDIPSLKEKPKIFIIQACKGALVPGKYKTDASVARGSPSEILKCYSTFEGYVSYRTEKGSPFVQALCEEIKLKGQNTDIEQLMKNAIESVKIRTRSNQIPCMTTNLTKPFVFGNYV